MALKLNNEAVAFAQQLIAEGRVNTEHANWEQENPTPAQQDEYLVGHSFGEYRKWFLAFNPDLPEDTKERYEFPIGNFNQIFRSGVIAAEKRAGQYKYAEIEAAAKALLALIDAQG